MAEKTSSRTVEQPALKITKVQTLARTGEGLKTFPFLSDITIRIHFSTPRKIYSPLFNLRILHKGQEVLEASMLIDGPQVDWVEGEGYVDCLIPQIPLTPKVYDILVFIRGSEGVADLDDMRIMAQFRITDEGLDQIPLAGPMAVNHMRQGSPVYVPHEWQCHIREAPTEPSPKPP